MENYQNPRPERYFISIQTTRMLVMLHIFSCIESRISHRKSHGDWKAMLNILQNYPDFGPYQNTRDIKHRVPTVGLCDMNECIDDLER